MADYHLVVLEPFGDFKRGEHIEDAKLIAEILADHRAVAVRKILAPQQ